MPFFPLSTFQEMTLAFFLGLGLFIFLYLAWGGYNKGPMNGTGEDRNRTEDLKPEVVTRAAHNHIPPFLVLVYVGVTLWILAYLIFVGLRNKAIG